MEYSFTKNNFTSEVVNSDKPVLVDFYADWCMPCKMMSPVVKQLADKYDNIAKVGKVNVDQQPELAGMFNVRSIPFFAVIKNGKLVDSALGAIPADELENMLKKAI